MHRILLLLLLITTGSRVFAQRATTIGYEYKIQYGGGSFKDSSRFLLAWHYYDASMHELKEVVLQPGQSDSCQTESWYDAKGNITKEVTRCSGDTAVKELSKWQYVYGSNGEIVRERFSQYKPSFECIVTEHLKKAMIRTFYSSEQNRQKGIFTYQSTDVYNALGKCVFSCQVNGNGDTTMAKAFLYFPVADTSKIRANIGAWISTKNHVEEIRYLDGYNNEVLTDYYDGVRYSGNCIQKYNQQQKLVLEAYYNKARNKITSEYVYSYDSKGNLLRKKETNFDDELTEVYTYQAKRLVRKDYVYGGFLDHSIVYVYKPYPAGH